jgi:PAS domain S-box-containing protein
VPFSRNGSTEDIYWTFSYSPLLGDSGAIEGILVVCCETTAKIENERRLTASEKRFQDLIHEAAVGIIVVEGEENVTTIVNEAYLRLIGHSYDEVINKPLFEVIPEAQDNFGATIDRVRSSGEPHYLNEYPYAVKANPHQIDGYLNVIYQPHRKDNQVIGVMILCQDVTAQVRLHKEVQTSEQRSRSFLESAPFPIGVYEGQEMTITMVNKAILEVWGKGDNVVGKSYFEVLPELQGQEIYPQLLNVYKTGIPFHARNQQVDLLIENTLRTFYFNYSFTPLIDGSGAIYGVMNTAADVTDLNIARLNSELSRKNFHNLILQAPVAMCLLLGEGHTINIANENMVRLWGKHRDDVMGLPVFEALPDAREQGLERLLDHVYQSGEAFTASEMPVNLVRYGKAETVYQNFVYEPYKDETGNVKGVIAISLEVTDQVLARHRIEEIVLERINALKVANQALLKSNEDLAQFAYVASHDLQEPLRKISLFSQLLETRLGSGLDQKSHEQLIKINQSSKRLQMLVSDILAYSQISSARKDFEPISLGDILNDIRTDFELLIDQKSGSLFFSELPDLYAHPMQMRQLFSNLISNSLKFAKKETPPIITVDANLLSADEAHEYGLDQDHPYFRILYKDNGIGFKPEYATKIFTIFQRLNSKSEYEGTGIGLAICKKIVANHNGAINAEKSSEKGAVFEIVLPAAGPWK